MSRVGVAVGETGEIEGVISSPVGDAVGSLVGGK
jgi:hypothetical protein